MSTESAFLAALAADEDNETVRFAYADWLDDNDRPEDADRQRRWPAAKAWLVAFAARCGETCENYAEAVGHWDGRARRWVDSGVAGRWVPITYADVVRAGRDCQADPDGAAAFVQMGREAARDLLDDERCRAVGEFWDAWSVVTGVPVRGGDRQRQPFSCSC